ncbi:glycosyltransferase family 2 protein [Arthrobacter sp. MDT1-48-3]
MRLTSVAVGFESGPIASSIAALGLDYAATPWQQRSLDEVVNWQHDAPLDTRWWGTYLVRAVSLAEARSILPLLRSEGKAERFVLVVEGHFPHQTTDSWTARHLADKTATKVSNIPGLGFAAVIEGSKWVVVHSAATAALAHAAETGSVQVLGGLRAGIVEPASRNWVAGDALASLLTSDLLQPDEDDIYAVDVIVGQPPVPLPRVEGRVTPPVWIPDPHDLPPVDTAVISPRGFLPYTGELVSNLTPEDLAAGDRLSERELAALRAVRYVAVDGACFSSLEWKLAWRLAQLSVAGVPLLASNLSIGVQVGLGDTLVELMEAFDPADAQVQRESKSINLRRAAIERFGPVQRWNGILRELHLAEVSEPTVSILLATRRLDKLASALAQIAQQSWDRIEVVLVLHGISAETPSVQQAIKTFSGPLTVVVVAAQTVFGAALAEGTKAASGEYLTKMDDDDWYGQHHVRDLVRAMQYSGAQLVGSQVEFVYLESLDITTRRPPMGERYSDHVAGGTMLLRLDDLRRLGGWRPVHRAVDRCLLQAVQADGGLIYRSHGQNYLMHRHAADAPHGGHTWNPQDSTFMQSVVEQWDGFTPPPQITARPAGLIGRADNFSSYFKTEDEGQ